MSSATRQLIQHLKNPLNEITSIREGVAPELVEEFLNEQSFPIKDVLKRLHIPKSTYFAKKRNHVLLDSSSTEKFFRLISILQMAKEILGNSDAKNWLYSNIPSLGDQVPMDLLDTEAGHRLVEQVLLQIKYSVYS